MLISTTNESIEESQFWEMNWRISNYHISIYISSKIQILSNDLSQNWGHDRKAISPLDFLSKIISISNLKIHFAKKSRFRVVIIFHNRQQVTKRLECMEKVLNLQVFNKIPSIFMKNHWCFKHNGVKCMKKYWFYKFSIKVGQFFGKKNNKLIF